MRFLISELLKFELTLINLALREKDTIQIGRTHGQHAEPITFGFAVAQYVSRFGSSILKIKTPLLWRVKSQLNKVVCAVPMCSLPVGDGAMRALTIALVYNFCLNLAITLYLE